MIDAHRGAFEYDWRARFSLPLSVVGKSMTWGEAFRLTNILAGDPSSALAAALNDWAFSMSREGLAVLDLYDLTHQVAWAQGGGKGRAPKAYPRPWPETSKGSRRVTPDDSLTQEQIIAALRGAGHTAPLPIASEV